MDFKNIFKYHKIILCISSRETINDLFGEIKSLVGDFIIAIASGLAYAIWSYFRQGAMIDWFGIVMSVVCGFIAWGIILFLYNLFWKVPAKLYREREGQALRRTWNDVEFSKNYFEDNQLISKVGFSIVSHKPSNHSIQYFCSNVISINTNSGRVYGDSTSDPKIQLHSYERSSLLEPFMKVQNPEIPSSLNKGKSIFAIKVAECKDGKATIYGYIDGKGELNPPKVVEIPCKIEIELYGYISDAPPLSDKMDNCTITYIIDEDIKNGLTVTMKRVPEYEY